MSKLSLMEWSSVWPLTHKEFLAFANGAMERMEFAELKPIYEKLKAGVMRMAEVRYLCELPVIPEDQICELNNVLQA